MKPILLLTGWRAQAACQYIQTRADAMRLGLRATERAADEFLLSVMQLEALR